MRPRVETKYARNGDVSIAYQVVGDGPLTLVGAPPIVSNVEADWDNPEIASFLTKLGAFCRLIHFDKRGQGLSDRDVDLPTLEVRVDDMLAVFEAEAVDRAALGGISEGGTTALLFAATYPERVSELVLCDSFARVVKGDDYEQGVPPDEWDRMVDTWTASWGTPRTLTVPIFIPSKIGDHEFLPRLNRYERLSSTPSGLRAQLQWIRETDVRSVLGAIRCPTLVLHRAGDRAVSAAHGRFLAEHIPGARYVELPGDDHLPYHGDSDAYIAEIEEFLTGSRHGVDTDRVLATVLFTDIVGSTERAAVLGDRAWRDLLDQHDSVARDAVAHHRGRMVKSTGDGLLATFDGPARGVRCATALVHSMRSIGLDIRAGLHTGEIEVRDDDVGGIAVHIGARVAAEAGPGEVLVSRTVKDLVAGSRLSFSDRGSHRLKGVPDEWQIFAVE